MHGRAITLTLAGLATGTLLAGCGATKQNDSGLPDRLAPASISAETPAGATSTCAYYLDIIDGVADPLLVPAC